VKKFKKGDSVGWGFLQSTCNYCKQCITGREVMCPDRALYGTANFDQGSFASHAIWREDYIFRIPDSIPREYAAPLMCGGATVFNALRAFDTQPTDRVGIIGVGGLGHLAIQFASKMGCEVVVFSGTNSKEDEAMKLGATEFIATKGVKELQTRPIDRLLVTAAFQPDWNQYIPILAPRASIYPLSVDSGDLNFPYMSIIRKELTIQGSLAAPRQVHREMLEFAARHNIRPIIEQFPMTVDGINEAMERLGSGKMRYRGVLIAQ
jgi:D-arabinose 1-dehydrogenase-like Zn-dependent alcohol dehydrogenase